MSDRLDALEAALQTGNANLDDVLWAIQKLRKATVAGIEFGALENVDPDLLRPSTDFDRCMLMLALVFNDFKDIAVVDGWLDHQKPAPEEISNYRGHWNGLRGHFDRLLVGMLHEFLNLLSDQAAVISGSEFQQLVATTPAKTQRAWKELGLLANKVDDNNTQRTLLFNALLQVRNQTAFHYTGTKSLAEGFAAHFDGSTEPARARAYFSIGVDMEATRFYYADAAANAHLERIGRNRGIDLRARTNDTLGELNLALGPLIANHISLRTGAQKRFFAAPQPTPKSAPRGGSTHDRNKEKAARRARRKSKRR